MWTRDTFAWDESILETCEGMALTVKMPKCLIRRRAAAGTHTALIANRAVRSRGGFGYLRFVVSGEFLNTSLPIRLTSVAFLHKPDRRRVFAEDLIDCVRQCVRWVLGCPTIKLPAQPHDTGPQPKKARLLQRWSREVEAAEASRLEDLVKLARGSALEEYWGSVGKKLSHRVESQTIRLTARRLVYAGASGKLTAFMGLEVFDNERKDAMSVDGMFFR